MALTTRVTLGRGERGERISENEGDEYLTRVLDFFFTAGPAASNSSLFWRFVELLGVH